MMKPNAVAWTEEWQGHYKDLSNLAKLAKADQKTIKILFKKLVKVSKGNNKVEIKLVLNDIERQVYEVAKRYVRAKGYAEAVEIFFELSGKFTGRKKKEQAEVFAHDVYSILNDARDTLEEAEEICSSIKGE